jgi:hypothetical protein
MVGAQSREDPQDPHWRGLEWTSWKQLDEAFRARAAIPRAAGVCRLRARKMHPALTTPTTRAKDQIRARKTA